MKQDNIEVAVPYSTKLHHLSMKLVFDIYTPRPHLIILQQLSNRKITVTNDEIQDLMKLVTEFLKDQRQYDDGAILSFHRGRWYQQNHRHFHAHLCVPKENYCHAVKSLINSKTTHHYWPSSIEYLQQLERDHETMKYRFQQYQNQCLAKFSRHLDNRLSSILALEKFSNADFSLVFLASTPRIGVLAKKANLHLTNLYDFMNRFYRFVNLRISLIDERCRNFGAHLCLYVTGTKTKKSKSNLSARADQVFVDTSEIMKKLPIVGYFQIDEELYLRWLPVNLRSIWIKEFQRVPHLVIT